MLSARAAFRLCLSAAETAGSSSWRAVEGGWLHAQRVCSSSGASSSTAAHAPRAWAASAFRGASELPSRAHYATTSAHDDDFLDFDVPIMNLGTKRPPQPGLLQQYLSEKHLNAQEQYKVRKHALIQELQEWDHDTGTMPVQIGLLSERISYLTRHCQEHRKDHHSRRGLLVLLSRRRKFLKYLRKKDFEIYVQTLRRFSLKDNYYQSGWGERFRVGSNLKWTPDQEDKHYLPPADDLRTKLAEQRSKSYKKPVRYSGRTLTPKALKTELFKEALLARRTAKLTAGWQQLLKSREQYLPQELAKPEFEFQRLQSEAQRGLLNKSEVDKLRQMRQAKTAAAREKREAQRAALADKLLPLHGVIGIDSAQLRM